MTTLTPERSALTRDLQMLCSGNSVQDVLCSLADVLATSVGFAAEDQAAADRLLEEMLPEMKAFVRKNWRVIRRSKATASNARGRA